MTTAASNHSWAHGSDANFRAWGAYINGLLSAAGLVQTADTGQINWTTATRPGTNTQAGFEIWRFNDSLQATTPIFLRIGYGTGNAASRPGLWLGVGGGTDGAGTLTTAETSVAISYANTTTSLTTGTYASWACHAAGFAGLVMAVGAAATGFAQAGFLIARTVDSSGAPNGDGYMIVRHNNATVATSLVRVQNVRRAATAVVGTLHSSNACGWLPDARDTAVVGGDTEVMTSLGCFTDVRPIPGIAHGFIGDIAENTTVSVALIGSTSRTYLSIGRQLGVGANYNNTTAPTLLMTWE